MQHEDFTARNIKCGGCAQAIRTGLRDLSGVRDVDVDLDSGEITIQGDDLSRDVLADKLRALGYPPVE